MSYPFDCDELRAAGDDARKRKREEAMFPPAVAAPWISVKERLPDSEGSYFVRVGRYHQPLVAKYGNNAAWDYAFVTHWMAIPELDK